MKIWRFRVNPTSWQFLALNFLGIGIGACWLFDLPFAKLGAMYLMLACLYSIILSTVALFKLGPMD